MKRRTCLSLLTRTLKAACRLFTPPPRLTVSEWADAYRYLSPESSAEPGKWRTDRTPYLKGIMDAVSDSRNDTIVFMSSAQIGKSEALSNTLAYFIDQDPSPILFVQPTVDMAKAYSKDRLAPMIRDTPRLTGKVKDAKSRDSNNTLLTKGFPGGHITMVGANSPAGLASRPIRIVLCDEVDRYPVSAGTEGDPVKLAFKRSNTFWNRKRILVSTPTIKGASRIEMAFNDSDKRLFYVPCPHCQTMQVLRWQNVKWVDHRPETAYMVCVECTGEMNDADILKAVKQGEWRATGTGRVAGFHINELYSPWRSLSDIVADFLEAKKNVETLRVWVNTSLGEPFEETGEQQSAELLYDRREEYDKVPLTAAVLTAGVDVQDDRLEVEILATGKSGETWSMGYEVIYGDLTKPEPWAELDEVLSRTFEHASGKQLKISATCIDSGGHMTKQVYDYTKGKEKRMIYAIKGKSEPGRVTVSRITRNNAGKVPLVILGVDTLKDTLFARLNVREHGAGFQHFPAHYEETYFQQLTAEQRITKYKNGVPYRSWQKKSSRNEALDCRIYAMGAFELLRSIRKVNVDKMVDKILATLINTNTTIPAVSPPVSPVPVEEEEIYTPEAPHPKHKSKKARTGGFVNRWK